MLAKQLRKPQNWQDFEDLCFRLWAEEWKCPETKKHGRLGQKQYGVDVYGTPRGTTDLIGIQCKGKDEYIGAQLTEKEIDKEIENAKSFKPALAKFYFATTANRSTDIDEYVRGKNKVSTDNGGFEIHVFFWDDIVQRIDQNRSTHDWYVNNQGFKAEYDIAVNFSSGVDVLSIEPLFISERTVYASTKVLDVIDLEPIMASMRETFDMMPRHFPRPKLRTKEDYINLMNEELPTKGEDWLSSPQPLKHTLGFLMERERSVNRSVGQFRITLTNTGSKTIDDFKLVFRFVNCLSVDTVDKSKDALDIAQYSYNVEFDSDMTATFYPERSVLVQGDRNESDEFCIAVEPRTHTCTIEWTLLARDFKRSGELKISINPVFEENERTKYVEHPDQFVDTVTIKPKIEFLWSAK